MCVAIIFTIILDSASIYQILYKGMTNNFIYSIFSYRFSVGVGNGTANYYYNPCQAFRMNKCWNTHVSNSAMDALVIIILCHNYYNYYYS